MFENLKDILNVEDLCSIFDIGLNTAYNLVRDKTIKSIKIGRQYKIPKTALMDFVNQTH